MADKPELPRTWEARMRALVNGAIQDHDCRRLALECSTIIDAETMHGRRPVRGDRDPIDRHPLWQTAVLLALACLGQTDDPLMEATLATAAKGLIVRCGVIADQILKQEEKV